MLKRSSLERKEFKQEELALMKKLDLNDIEIMMWFQDFRPRL